MFECSTIDWFMVETDLLFCGWKYEEIATFRGGMHSYFLVTSNIWPQTGSNLTLVEHLIHLQLYCVCIKWPSQRWRYVKHISLHTMKANVTIAPVYTQTQGYFSLTGENTQIDDVKSKEVISAGARCGQNIERNRQIEKEEKGVFSSCRSCHVFIWEDCGQKLHILFPLHIFKGGGAGSFDF